VANAAGDENLIRAELTIIVRVGRIHPCGAHRWKVELYQAKAKQD